MQLHYDEDFIEAAVSLCSGGRRQGVPSQQIARFHREREQPYSILDPDERNAAFFRLHLKWFRQWGMEKLIADVLQEFPLLPETLALLAVRKALGRHDEGAELYVNQRSQRNGIVALRPERFLQDGSLQDYLRHEFTHLRDMLDPAFGYSPELDLPGLQAAQRRLARERYRLLWDISIDGRLAATGHPPMANREQHAAAFSRAYPFWSASSQASVFDSLWNNTAPRHAHFLALIADPRGLRDAHRPAPGAPCPLCDFSTFEWSPAETLSPEILSLIGGEFPSWTPAQGLCGRCRDAYEIAASVRLPAAV